MTALGAVRDPRQYGVGPVPTYLPAVGVAASTKIWAGALVAITLLGALAPASADPTLKVVGVAEETYDNTSGLINAVTAKKIRRGVFAFVNSASTGALTTADIGASCFAVDDQTVSRLSGNSLRPLAGRVVGFEGTLVLVEVGVAAIHPTGMDVRIAAGADLSTHQYKLVKLSSGAVVLCGAGERPLGVLQNAPASGEIAIVRTHGATIVKADGTGVTQDNSVSSAANGVARATTNAATGLGVVDTSDAGAATDPLKGAYIIGQALQTAAASALFEMVITHGGTQASTAV
jgi:hypothetical protein